MYFSDTQLVIYTHIDQVGNRLIGDHIGEAKVVTRAGIQFAHPHILAF